jgi:hypothetical protein
MHNPVTPAINARIASHAPGPPSGAMGLTESALGCGPDVFGKPGRMSSVTKAEVLVRKLGSPL